ncbi:Exoglucanase 1 [Podospora australis]|uniref:Glucanase n=1 Tax=Podospora australis TaxID=1536484 RepID=A0AAN7ACH0_9PEZI|nr:Exoglucanase 1 [Podospora australis]
MRPALGLLLSITAAALPAAAQKPGTLNPEVHPKLQWNSCSADGSCAKVQGELTIDDNWRWVHDAKGYTNCYSDGRWDSRICTTEANCTANCVVEGANRDDYRYGYGVNSTGDTVSLRLWTGRDFSSNVNSRLFLLESEDKYQTFTLAGNEVAFDVDLGSVECGINAALYFVGMEADGGKKRFPDNEAGAKYGTGYCDASCPMSLRFVGGKTNSEGWRPDEYGSGGQGYYGACCPEFALWNGNAHSSLMASRNCVMDNYRVCEAAECGVYSDSRFPTCDSWGCRYNAFQMGAPDFYGKNKTLNTLQKFTVVTRFDAQSGNVTRFYIQDGKKIELPFPTWEGLPQQNAITEDVCIKSPEVFDEGPAFVNVGGWQRHRSVLNQPLVLVMSISTNYWDYNANIDSTYPDWDPWQTAPPGKSNGPCYWEDGRPEDVQARYRNAKVVWSNIRFGPIGSTVKV